MTEKKSSQYQDHENTKTYEENNSVINNNPRTDENQTKTAINRNKVPGEEEEE